MTATRTTLHLTPALRIRRNPWRAFSLAARLIPCDPSATFGGMEALFREGVRPSFIPVYTAKPRRNHIRMQEMHNPA
jgi:hypothetical protein